MDHRVAPRHGTCLVEQPFAIILEPNRYERTTAVIGNTYSAHRRSSPIFMTFVLKTAPKRPFLDTKSAMEQARRLQTGQTPSLVMRLCSQVVLSNLDAGFEPRCPCMDFLTACCCCSFLLAACCLLLLLLKCVVHLWALRRGVKPRLGKTSCVKTLD